MPIRGDRLRWPPRPGKKYSETSGTSGVRRSMATDHKQVDDQPPLHQPNERDESSDPQDSAPRAVIRQAHDDIESGKEDTDCRNRVSEVLDPASSKPQEKTQPASGDA